MITAVIVDDEPDCCESLVILLERYCPEVKVLDICYSAEAAIQSIREHEPKILFLDIEMPFMNGFELLEKLGTINFELIFTTSYDQYAIKAIRFSALDYLLKPIDREELQKSVQKAVQRNQHPLPQQLEMLLQKLNFHMNPLNARWNLADRPENYKWSSAKFYEGGLDDFGFLTHFMDRI